MSEAKFWNEIKRNIGGSGHFSRVESGETSVGIPDVDYCIDGIEGHLEIKYGTGDKLPKIRPSQVNWFKARHKAGGSPFLLAKIITNDKPKYFFFRADRIQKLAHANVYTDWEVLSNFAWFGEMNWSELIYLLKGGNPAYADKSL